MGVGRYKDGRRTCEVCGRFTHSGFLCKDHTYAQKQGQLGLCDKCGSFYLFGEECRVCNEVDSNLFAGELEEADIEAISQHLRNEVLHGWSGHRRGTRRSPGDSPMRFLRGVGRRFPGNVPVPEQSLAGSFIKDRWGFTIDERQLFKKLKFAVQRSIREIIEEHLEQRFVEIEDGSTSKRYLAIRIRHSNEYFLLTPVESTDRDYLAVHQCAEPHAKEIPSNLQKEVGVGFTFRAVPTKTD